MSHQTAWQNDVRIRIRPGRDDSGVKLYVTDHEADGPRELMANTRFFRYPRLFEGLVALLREQAGESPLRVCIVPLSVGLEAVSFAIAGLRAGLFDARQVSVEGFDLSAKASELARGGVYPGLFFPDDLSPYGGLLEALPDGFVKVGEAVASKISVLPAQDILSFRPENPYDMVICLNLLMHMAEQDRQPLVDRLAAITGRGGVLCLNNNQEWPEELAPHYRQLTSPDGGFVSLHARFEAGPGSGGANGPAPDFAVTDANAMILRREAA